MMTKIADYFPTVQSVPADGDTTTTIADLAVFTEFDPDEASTGDTATWCVAFDALRVNYEGHEMVRGEGDFYDGFFMQFADGSQLRYTAP